MSVGLILSVWVFAIIDQFYTMHLFSVALGLTTSALVTTWLEKRRARKAAEAQRELEYMRRIGQ